MKKYIKPSVLFSDLTPSERIAGNCPTECVLDKVTSPSQYVMSVPQSINAFRTTKCLPQTCKVIYHEELRQS